jgi:selenocysteine-specific elongation factor
MPREELRGRAFARAAPGVFDHVLAALEAEAELRTRSDGVALAGHEVRLSSAEQEARRGLVELALAAGLAGIDLASVAERTGGERKQVERVAGVLQAEGLLRRVGEDRLVHREPLEALVAELRRRWPPGTRLDVAEIKDLTGLTRKFLIPLLEYLDREHVTRRVGAERRVAS